jgi:hypothetical protein
VQVLLYAQLLQIPQAIVQCKSFIDSKAFEQQEKQMTFGGLFINNTLASITSMPLRFSAPAATMTSEKSKTETDRVLRPIPSHAIPQIRFEESHPQVKIANNKTKTITNSNFFSLPRITYFICGFLI